MQLARAALLALVTVLVAVACASSPAAIVPRAPDIRAVTPADFELLRFLDGRWAGRGPDGVAFFEEFRFTGPATVQVGRFADADFEEPLSGGTLEVVNGRLVYRSGHHRWVAQALTARQVDFAPIEDAPTHFSWRLDGDGRLRWTHAWTSMARSHELVVKLARVERS